MKNFLSILFIMNTLLSISQNEIIDAAVTAYDAQIENAAEEEMEGIVPHIKTTCPLILPAIGEVNHEIDIYFDLNREEAEDNGVVLLLNIATIRKVHFSVKSGSYELGYSFYFDTEGALIFHSLRSEDAYSGCTLDSYYFKNEKCVLLRTELFATDFCEVSTENVPVLRTDLTDKEHTTVTQTIEMANRFRNLLAIYCKMFLD